MKVFESHITVKINSLEDLKAFEEIAQIHKCKVIRIKEDSASSPLHASQVMTGKFHKCENYETALKEMHDISYGLRVGNIKVIREKIERIGKIEVGDPDLDKIKYKEYHFKFKNSPRVKEWAEGMLCHTSLNEKNLEYIFVTTRDTEIAQDILFQSHYQIQNKIEESVLFDSNQSFDSGWAPLSCMDCKLKSQNSL